MYAFCAEPPSCDHKTVCWYGTPPGRTQATCINQNYFCMFVLILNIPVNGVSVMSGWIFLARTSTKQRIKCFTEGHNTMPPPIAARTHNPSLASQAHYR